MKYNYFFLKEKYIKYLSKLKERENINIINNSVNNKKKTFNYYNNENNYDNNKNIYSQNNNIRKIKLLRLINNEDNKNIINSNSNDDFFITNIGDISDSYNQQLNIKSKKEKFSEIQLILDDTNDKIDEIGLKLKTFDENSQKNHPKSIKYLYDFIKKVKNEEKKINFKTIFNNVKKDNNNMTRYVKINLNNSNQIKRNKYSFVKKSTADLINYCQSLQLMPDEYFYKERKRIIRKYPLLQKEANLVYKSEDNIKDNHKQKVNYNYLVDNNLKIINNMLDNNITLFNKILNN